MRYGRDAALALLVASASLVPLSDASARCWRWHCGGPGLLALPFVAAGADCRRRRDDRHRAVRRGRWSAGPLLLRPAGLLRDHRRVTITARVTIPATTTRRRRRAQIARYGSGSGASRCFAATVRRSNREETPDAGSQSLRRRCRRDPFPRHRNRMGRGRSGGQTVEAAAGDWHHLPRGPAELRP